MATRANVRAVLRGARRAWERAGESEARTVALSTIATIEAGIAQADCWQDERTARKRRIHREVAALYRAS